MDYGTLMSIRPSDNAGGRYAGAELVFNVLSGDATLHALGGGSPVYPAGLPDGNGYLMQLVSGGEQAEIRTAVDDRPRMPGAIVHDFQRGAKIIEGHGLVVATAPEYRTYLDDNLRGFTAAMEKLDGNLFWLMDDLSVRTLRVRLYESLPIEGQASSAAPKEFTLFLIAGDPDFSDGAYPDPSPTGFTGPRGNTGAAGSLGRRAGGVSGPTGPSGADGPAGATGHIGLAGYLGPAGSAGAPGSVKYSLVMGLSR